MRFLCRPRAFALATVFALALGATSCGGGGGSPNLVLVGFNVPNVSGIPLNQPLLFTFTADVDPSSITPDTLRVVGEKGPNFETTVIDGNLVALLPRSPNFEDYSDAGLLPGIKYTVSLATYPAPSTIRSTDGKPLLDAPSYQFTTVPAPLFIEPRRPINHGLPPPQGRSDDNGCLNNSQYEGIFDLYPSWQSAVQFGSGPGARLLCLQNEGPPEVVLDDCSPKHGEEAVGTPSAVTPGYVNLPGLRVRFNEPLDPLTVVPWEPATKFGINVQLWLVGDTDKQPLVGPPKRIRINQPSIVQSLTQTEIIIVPSNENDEGLKVGGVPQGTYLINITGAVTDLPGNSLQTDDFPGNDPALTGFQPIEDSLGSDVPNGFRLYFVTLVVPGTAQSISEGFASNLAEYGDADSGDTEPGVFEQSAPPTSTRTTIPGATGSAPSYTLVDTTNGIGQSTSANWNDGFRFWGLSSLEVNTDVDTGTGQLKAVYKPYLGRGEDGAFDKSTQVSLNTDTGSVNGDGIYEFDSFWLRSGGVLKASGSAPLVILCRGEFRVDGTIELNGTPGGVGLDTDGDVRYTAASSIPAGGVAGVGAAGGGGGGAGSNPLLAGANGQGASGASLTTVFGTGSVAGGGGGEASVSGGGGGGFPTAGGAGVDSSGTTVSSTAGAASGSTDFHRDLSQFGPDRCYSPNSNGSGGQGGGGGGADDTTSSGTWENGDAGGGGGGGAGGGIYVLAGSVVVNGTIQANGGAGGSVYAVDQQDVDLGADAAPGGTGADADAVVGILAAEVATPMGHGGPGGGGSGGGIFLMGADSLDVASTAVLSASGGAGGSTGATSAQGGDGSAGIITLATRPGMTLSVDGSASVSPSYNSLDYKPTIDNDSVGQSEWVDLFTPSTKFTKMRWTTNAADLHVGVGPDLVEGTDWLLVLEVQAADTLSDSNSDGVIDTATGLTSWTVVHANDPSETSVSWDAGGGSPSPFDGKRFIRWRWRFDVPDTYPAFGTSSTAAPMPAVNSFTIEFER